MRFEFDPVKSARNERERGLPFPAAARLFDSATLEWEDKRREYGETRFCALDEIDKRVVFVAFTRRKDAVRIISFRKANPRETRKFGQYIRREGARDAN